MKGIGVDATRCEEALRTFASGTYGLMILEVIE